ncbi:hypothetical protein WMY93_001875 [Mugilogobius chulae]|uniref:Rubicon Homology domain-containing protein n=1 Tax=Mugilogobius chulae TaxID=88201 RepID=A0AAW0Q329_9GOBI
MVRALASHTGPYQHLTISLGVCMFSSCHWLNRRLRVRGQADKLLQDLATNQEAFKDTQHDEKWPGKDLSSLISDRVCVSFRISPREYLTVFVSLSGSLLVNIRPCLCLFQDLSSICPREYLTVISPREYLLQHIHLYSLADLQQVIDGKLAPFLSKVIKFASSHVFSCSLCREKGFICELCPERTDALLPFPGERPPRDATAAAPSFTPSVVSKLSRVLAASAASSTTNVRRPSGPRTTTLRTATTCPSKTREDTPPSPLRKLTPDGTSSRPPAVLQQRQACSGCQV